MSGYGLAYSMRGYAGNHKRHAVYAIGPESTHALRIKPCGWERLLLDIGVSEPDALALIGTATPEWARIAEWTRENGYDFFAPEEIVDALGMSGDWRWGNDVHVRRIRGAARQDRQTKETK